MKAIKYLAIGVFSSLIFLMFIGIIIYKYATGPILSYDYSQVKNIKYRIIGATEWKDYLHIKLYIRGISIDKIDKIYEVLNDREILEISKRSSPTISLLDSLIIHKDSIYLEIYNQNVVNVDEVNPNIHASLIFKKESPCIKGKFASDCYRLINVFEVRE